MLRTQGKSGLVRRTTEPPGSLGLEEKPPRWLDVDCLRVQRVSRTIVYIL